VGLQQAGRISLIFVSIVEGDLRKPVLKPPFPNHGILVEVFTSPDATRCG
jgi:hypothetical protein